MKNKIRWIAAAVLAMGMMCGSMTASAFVDETAMEENVDVYIGETEPETEATPFAIPGNGQLVDDKENDGTKQFLTVQTKNGNTFFLVIDRSSNMENVYMLSMIDEDDLAEFVPEGQEGETETEAPTVWMPETEPEPVETEPPAMQETEPETEPAQEGMGGQAVLWGGILLAVVIALLFYMKVVKPKKSGEGADSEDLEFYDDGTYIRDDQDDDPDND